MTKRARPMGEAILRARRSPSGIRLVGPGRSLRRLHRHHEGDFFIDSPPGPPVLSVPRQSGAACSRGARDGGVLLSLSKM
jgi:hypothetical protein